MAFWPDVIGFPLRVSSCGSMIVFSLITPGAFGLNTGAAARPFVVEARFDSAVIETLPEFALIVGGPRLVFESAPSAAAEVLTSMMLSASDPLMFAVELSWAP